MIRHELKISPFILILHKTHVVAQRCGIAQKVRFICTDVDVVSQCMCNYVIHSSLSLCVAVCVCLCRRRRRRLSERTLYRLHEKFMSGDPRFREFIVSSLEVIYLLEL